MRIRSQFAHRRAHVRNPLVSAGAAEQAFRVMRRQVLRPRGRVYCGETLLWGPGLVGQNELPAARSGARRLGVVDRIGESAVLLRCRDRSGRDGSDSESVVRARSNIHGSLGPLHQTGVRTQRSKYTRRPRPTSTTDSSVSYLTGWPAKPGHSDWGETRPSDTLVGTRVRSGGDLHAPIVVVDDCEVEFAVDGFAVFWVGPHRPSIRSCGASRRASRSVASSRAFRSGAGRTPGGPRLLRPETLEHHGQRSGRHSV